MASLVVIAEFEETHGNVKSLSPGLLQPNFFVAGVFTPIRMHCKHIASMNIFSLLPTLISMETQHAGCVPTYQEGHLRAVLHEIVKVSGQFG